MSDLAPLLVALPVFGSVVALLAGDPREPRGDGAEDRQRDAQRRGGTHQPAPPGGSPR